MAITPNDERRKTGTGHIKDNLLILQMLRLIRPVPIWDSY